MVVGAVLAIAASVGYGVSDVVSGSAVRRYSTAAVALWSQLVGFALLAVAAAVLRPAVAWPSLGWGVGAGALGAVALLLFYTALQRGPTAIVAPVAGSGVVIPVVTGLLGGEPVGWRVGLGVAAVVAGVLVVAATGGGDGDGPDESGAADGPRRRLIRASPAPAHPVPVHDGCVPEDGDGATRSAVVLAAVAALGFGAFFVVLDEATGRAAGGGGAVGPSVAVALAVQVGALLVTGLVATRHSRACLVPRRGLLAVAGSVGLVDVVADLVLVLAVGTGPLAVVGPLASLDPVVSVLIATAVLGERLRVAQVLGIAAVLAGVVLVATG